MTKLIFVRHGQTNKNITDSLHSGNDLEVLNENGINQIKKTAKRLADYSPVRIVSSKEKRAIQSAEIIADILNIPAEIVDGIQERNWGNFSEKPWSAVETVLNKMSFDERFTYVPEGGESWAQTEKRLVMALNKITELNKDKCVVVVCHGGVIRILMPYLLNLPRQESFKYNPGNASLTIFDFDGAKFTQCIVDDASHLT